MYAQCAYLGGGPAGRYHHHPDSWNDAVGQKLTNPSAFVQSRVDNTRTIAWLNQIMRCPMRAYVVHLN